jgi:hypothetical protein
MPIQFKFMNPGDNENNCELLPAGALTRMASPVILRPFAVAQDQAYAMILRLNTPGVDTARLKAMKGTPAPSTALDGRAVPAGEIRNAAAAGHPGSPLSGFDSAVGAFLHYARTKISRGEL